MNMMAEMIPSALEAALSENHNGVSVWPPCIKIGVKCHWESCQASQQHDVTLRIFAITVRSRMQHNDMLASLSATVGVLPSGC